MKTIELNGVTLIVSEATARTLQAELEEDRIEAEREANRKNEERKFRWVMWNWHARRWAMYGSAEDGALFSDMYKDENGCRPHMSRKDVFWILYERECWIEHGPHCAEYRKAKARGWGLY